MKTLALITIFFCGLSFAVAQPQFELSRNIYRIPYASGTSIKITNDHFSHDPQGRYDMIGTGNGSSCSINYKIVAAAAGVVRRIVDRHDVHGPDCDTDCADYNNYIWIEHANGEWSKYTHMMKNSISVSAGLTVGDTICAGTFLGYECEIGHASGPHLHFEVRHPNNPANIQIDVAGGFMHDAVHYIPVINSIFTHYFSDNDTWTASGSSSCTTNQIVPGLITVNGTVRVYMASSAVTTDNHNITYVSGSNGLFQAGNSVTITPGFTANAGSYFHARIDDCGTTPFPGGCN